MKILIGEITSYKAIVICNFIALSYKNIEIQTFDFRKFSKRIRSRHSKKHHYIEFDTINDYQLKLSEIIKKENIDVFIPVHSDYLDIFIQNREIFADTLSYMGSFSDYQMLHNKSNLLHIAEQLQITTPKSYPNIEEAICPFVAKPQASSSAKGVIYIKNEKEKNILLHKCLNGYIFQEYISGYGCGYSVFAQRGEIKIGYGHKRLAEYPVSGGSSVYRSEEYDPRMKIIAQKILEQVKWSGFAMFEFKHTKDDRLILIEVNPRIWGSINQGLQEGVNYFEPILGKGVYKKHNQKYFTYLSPQSYISFLSYLLKGNFTPIWTFIRNIKKNKSDVNLFDDPLGYASIILRNVL